MAYAPLLLTLISAIIGVFGTTWDPERNGIKKVTWKGWTVILLALVSAGLSAVSLSRDNAERTEFRRTALREVHLAADRLLSPYRALYVQFKGPGFYQSTRPMPEKEALEHLRGLIPAKDLTSPDFLTYLANIDIMSASGDLRSGKRLPYLDHIALRAAEGRTAIEKALTLGGELLPIKVRSAATALIQSPYIAASEARPSALRSLPSSTHHTVLPLPGSAGQGVIDDFKKYIKLVDSLHKAASEEQS